MVKCTAIDELKVNFEIGLHTTIRVNLTIHETIGPVLVPTPTDVGNDLLNPRARPRRFFSRSIQPIGQLAGVGGSLPFHGINKRLDASAASGAAAAGMGA